MAAGGRGWSHCPTIPLGAIDTLFTSWHRPSGSKWIQHWTCHQVRKVQVGKVHSVRGRDVGKSRFARNEERMAGLFPRVCAREASSRLRETSQVVLQQCTSLFGLDPSVDDPADHRKPLTLHEYIDRVRSAEVAPPLLVPGIRHEDDQPVTMPGVLHGRGDRAVRHAPGVADDTGRS